MSDNNVTTIDKDNSQSSHYLSITAKDNLATWQVGLVLLLSILFHLSVLYCLHSAFC